MGVPHDRIRTHVTTIYTTMHYRPQSLQTTSATLLLYSRFRCTAAAGGRGRRLLLRCCRHTGGPIRRRRSALFPFQLFAFVALFALPIGAHLFGLQAFAFQLDATTLFGLFLLPEVIAIARVDLFAGVDACVVGADRSALFYIMEVSIVSLAMAWIAFVLPYTIYVPSCCMRGSLKLYAEPTELTFCMIRSGSISSSLRALIVQWAPAKSLPMSRM